MTGLLLTEVEDELGLGLTADEVDTDDEEMDAAGS